MKPFFDVDTIKAQGSRQSMAVHVSDRQQYVTLLQYFADRGYVWRSKLKIFPNPDSFYSYISFFWFGKDNTQKVIARHERPLDDFLYFNFDEYAWGPQQIDVSLDLLL